MNDSQKWIIEKCIDLINEATELMNKARIEVDKVKQTTLAVDSNNKFKEVLSGLRSIITDENE